MSDDQAADDRPDEPAGDGEEAPPKNKPKRFPTAFTVLAIVLLVVWLASFVIPAGQYKLDPKTGGPVPASYTELPSCDSTGDKQPCSDRSILHQFSNLWASPTDGLYGNLERQGTRLGRQRGLPVRIGSDLPVRPRDRRVHHRDDEDRRHPARHRPARAPLQAPSRRC